MTLSETLQKQRIQLLALLLLLAAVYARIVQQMVLQWANDENYSHGFIVPLIAAWLLYEQRRELRDTPVVPWNGGFFVIGLGLLQLVTGFLATELFTQRSSLLTIIAGLLLTLFGRQFFRRVAAPFFYLILMIPLPYIVYDSVAFPLKLLVSRMSVDALQLMGIVVLREGNLIMFPALTLEVVEACSGMRSLVSLLALSAAYGFYLRFRGIRFWLLILSTLPIAICTNAIRIIVTGVLAQQWGAKAASGFFHEFAGLAVFGLAMAFLLQAGRLIQRKRSG